MTRLLTTIITLLTGRLPVLLLLLALCGCSEPSRTAPIILEGQLEGSNLAEEGRGPLFLAVLDEMPANFESLDLTSVKAIVSVDPEALTFSVDLSRTDLKAGDRIFLAGFQDNDFSETPAITPGDLLGFYLEPDTFSPAYRLAEGRNTDITISVNRPVFSFQASVSGTISGEGNGAVTVIAYTGSIDSLDFTQIDPDKIIGYTTLEKQADTVTYHLPILPFGYNVPIDPVFVFAFLDANGNDRPDAGDPIAFYPDEAGSPASLVITETDLAGIDLPFVMTLSQPSGFTVTMEGRFDVDPGLDRPDSTRFVIVMNAETGLQSGLTRLDPADIAYFQKLPPGETAFRFDLSGISLIPGDEVMIIALLDNDYAGGFPALTPGDAIGWYQNTHTYAASVQLADGVNTIEPSADWLFAVDREVFDFQASISGTVSGAQTGTVTLAAYAGEISSLDFIALDPRAIIGYAILDKQAASEPFTLDILPFGFNLPIENVYLLAILDANNNHRYDGGDSIGFPQTEQGLPRLLTVRAGDLPDQEIVLSQTIPEPSGYALSVSGSFTVAQPFQNSPGVRFVIITDADPASGELFSTDLSGIRYFEKLPAGAETFSVDLSATGLAPGDPVRVFILQDADYAAGFPFVNTGDRIGFFQDANGLPASLALPEGRLELTPEKGWDCSVDRTWYNQKAAVSFTLDESALNAFWVNVHLDPGEQVTALVVQEAGVTIGLSPSIDTRYVVGYGILEVPPTGNSGYGYTVNILPAIFHEIAVSDPFEIRNVYVLALFDGNTSDPPEKNNYLGYYWEWAGLFRQPAVVPVISDQVNPLDRSVRFTLLQYSF